MRGFVALVAFVAFASAEACDVSLLHGGVADAADAATGEDGPAGDSTADDSSDGGGDSHSESSGSLACASSDLVCAGRCASPTDPRTCGACANDCTAGTNVSGAIVKCAGGMCSYECPPNRSRCGNACVDLQADKSHCGSCTTTCPIACSAAICAGPLALAAGWQHTCALLPGGVAACWGSNRYGQLGNGMDIVAASPPITRPTPVSTMVGATALVAGEAYTCALGVGGSVRCWGYNAKGELGNGTGVSTSSPVAVSNLAGATALAAGYDHSCAALTDGSVRCWGSNVAGELGDGTTVTAYTPVAVRNLAGAIALAVGMRHTCALLSGGTVECWGDNTEGELGSGGAMFNSSVPVPVSGVARATAIAAGGQHTCALLSDGTVRCWGSNLYGQLGDGTITSSFSPVVVSNVSGATGLVAGWGETCALLPGGAVRCWGYNADGQLGDGTTSNSLSPVPVTNLNSALALTAGEFHACAVRSGDVQCWGSNNSGQLGDGTTTNSPTPMAVVW